MHCLKCEPGPIGFAKTKLTAAKNIKMGPKTTFISKHLNWYQSIETKRIKAKSNYNEFENR